MLRTVIRRPSPAAVFALLVLVVIAAPLADAAQNAVNQPNARAAAEKKKVERARFADKAKFADNAGKVRGYSVGFAALPSRLVLTQPNGKLPKAVIPEGTQGPQGPQGPPGAAGGFDRTTLEFVHGERSTTGVADLTTACPAGSRIAGGGHEVDFPVRTGQAGGAAAERGVVEVRKSMPVPLAGGASGWRVQVVRVPPEVNFVTPPGGGPPVAQPNTTPSAVDKIVQITVWAVCVSR